MQVGHKPIFAAVHQAVDVFTFSWATKCTDSDASEYTSRDAKLVEDPRQRDRCVVQIFRSNHVCEMIARRLSNGFVLDLG